MRRAVPVSFLVLSMFVLTEESSAQDSSPKPPEVAVTGRGSISVVPDRAIVLAAVINNASSAADAGSENARIVSNVIARVRAAGVTDKQITNSGYSLGQDFENGDRRKSRGFQARNTVRIEVGQVADVGKVLDAALAGGATEIQPIQFMGPDMPGARAQALRAAVQDARRDAEILAEAAGGSLGKLLSISSGQTQSTYYELVTVTAASAVSPTAIRPNDVTVSAFANARWEFVPKR